MARIRTIKPTAFNSADFCALSPLARCLFFALLCEADRLGRLEYAQANLKLRYLPGDPKADVDALVSEMEQRGMVVRYEVEGRQYALIQNFLKHQRPGNKEPQSLLPAPADSSVLEKVRVEGEGKGRGKGSTATTLSADADGRQIQSFIDGWNNLAPKFTLARISKLTPARKRKLLARLKDPGFSLAVIEDWVIRSKAVHGQQWFTFDWILSQGNYLKLIEGNYLREFGSNGYAALPQKSRLERELDELDRRPTAPPYPGPGVEQSPPPAEHQGSGPATEDDIPF